MIIGMTTNLNVYYSAACNMKCEYCGAGPSNEIENEVIRAKIQSGEFQEIVKNKCRELQPATLGVWGKEPTINQDLWASFIIPILDNCDSIKCIFFSTNGLQLEPLTWLTPLQVYCATTQRKIKLWIQFSIDDPLIDTRAVQKLYDTIETYVPNEYFELKLSTKSTLTKPLSGNAYRAWRQNMSTVVNQCKTLNTNCDIELVGSVPTLAVSGNYTQEDGRQLADSGLAIDLLNSLKLKDKYGCSAGDNSFTIDCNNNVYDCLLKSNNSQQVITYQQFLHHAMPLFKQKKIVRNDWNIFYKYFLSNYCWNLYNENNIDNFILLWGNNGLYHLYPFDYRGGMKPWNGQNS